MAPRIEKEQIHAFAADLARELGATVDPAFSEHYWAFGLILEPGIRLFAAINNGKATYNLTALANAGRSAPISVECGVAMSRGADAAAKDIRSRLLPDAMPKAKAALARFAEQDAAWERVAKKAAQLAKRYPNLRIRVDPNDRNRIQIDSKYGAGIHLDAYAYEDATPAAWIWRLTSERGRAFALDDLDSKYGRAFLKLCNEN